jgi:hypothetical protein
MQYISRQAVLAAHLNRLNLIIRIELGEVKNLWSSLLHSFLIIPICVSLLATNVLHTQIPALILSFGNSYPSSAELKNGGAVPSLRHTSSWCGA